MRLDAVVSCLFCDLEGELQRITRAQGDRIRAFFERNPVQVILFSTSELNIYITYGSERSWPPSGPMTVKRGD